MGTLDRIRHYRLRRDRILQGKFNCIPWPFQRFKNYVPGTEKGKYIIITANQKVGKSKLADYMGNLNLCDYDPQKVGKAPKVYDDAIKTYKMAKAGLL